MYSTGGGLTFVGALVIPLVIAGLTWLVFSVLAQLVLGLSDTFSVIFGLIALFATIYIIKQKLNIDFVNHIKSVILKQFNK
jgi:hypothetical protein